MLCKCVGHVGSWRVGAVGLSWDLVRCWSCDSVVLSCCCRSSRLEDLVRLTSFASGALFMGDASGGKADRVLPVASFGLSRVATGTCCG